VIFENVTDSTGEVRLKMAILPTQEPGGGADPERSVRRT
jgi:hypothetical protein